MMTTKLDVYVLCLQRPWNMDLHGEVEAVDLVSNSVTFHYYVNINTLLLHIGGKLKTIKAWDSVIT